MSKEEILSYFASNAYSYNIKQTIVMLLFGLFVGIIIYITYFLCSEKVVYNPKFNLSLLITVLITDVIMLLISSNIVVSLGMVGALSIVRFRTAIKDSRDTVFIFWAITEGLCVGTKSFKMTIVSVAFIAIIFVVGCKLLTSYGKYLLVINAKNDVDGEIINKKICDNARYYQLRATNSNGESKEYIYEFRMKNRDSVEKVVDEMTKVAGVQTVNCVLETGELEG